MCTECGCGLPGERPAKISGGHAHEHGHPHEHEHVHADGTRHSHPHHHPHEHGPDHSDHAHPHDHSHDSGHHHHEHEQEDPHANQARRTLEIRQAILAKNERLAERNRGYFIGRGLLAINVVSSPGSGKTTFLGETIKALGDEMKAGVIVGDLATDNDAVRLREAGAPVVQVTTGTVCHLEAEMVSKALSALPLDSLKLLIIENVGNLVCPASYDLGEHLRVVLLSVTEGEDKPLKYPPMFQSANVVVISKMDLAGACDFDREKALANIRRVSPGARIFEVSSRTGQGMKEWCDFLKTQAKAG